MDAKQLVAWLVPILVRGIAWILAAKLGMEAAEAQDLATQAGAGLGALVLVGISIWTSVKGRKKLLLTDPTLPRN
jgi:hypothetical protein